MDEYNDCQQKPDLLMAANKANAGVPVNFDVVLISMPFGPPNTPSIGLGILKSALLEKCQVHSTVKYFGLDFLDIIGFETYSLIADGFPTTSDLLGEWIFSNHLFSKPANHLEEYISNVTLNRNVDELMDSLSKSINVNNVEALAAKLRSIINSIEPFIEQCAKEVLQHRPKIIGFTSVFQQQLASLCLAKKIKELDPAIIVTFGGANVESVMGKEVVERFDFVDYVISGDGDNAFPELCQFLLANPGKEACGASLQHINKGADKPGVLAFKPVEMDAVPVPDYKDYFDALNRLTKENMEKISPRILFESSRGCWWGEHHHCTFCGLNGGTMKHRSKTAETVLKELSYLTSQYPGCSISVVDNIIDMGYFKTLVPKLAELEQKYTLFYEVKANLKKDQIRALSLAGISTIQPGIESLSSSVLKTMNKGVSAHQNIQLLKWCQEYNVVPLWNFLWGFPKEDIGEYPKMAGIIDKLHHLQPPDGGNTIRVDRFSPNHSTYSEQGFTNIYPYKSYSYVYNTFSDHSLNNLAYFFDFESLLKDDINTYTKEMQQELKTWTDNNLKSEFFYIELGEVILICDFRKHADKKVKKLSGSLMQLFLICDKATTYNEICSIFSKDFIEIGQVDILPMLEHLVSESLLLFIDDRYLSVAVKVNDFFAPSKDSVAFLYDWMEANLEKSESGEYIL